VAYVAFNHLRGIPTAGTDLILVLGCVGIGDSQAALSAHIGTA
jgi:hypothetical protein